MGLAAVFTLAVALSWSACRQDGSQSRTGPPAVVLPPSPRPVPPSLHPLYFEIRSFQERGDYGEAARRYGSLLKELARIWGPGSPDLPSYHYDFALALKLAGNPAEALKVTGQALEAWPSSLELSVLDATVRAESSIARGGFDPRAHGLFRTILTPENLPRLRGFRLEPAALYAQWSEMLRLASREEEALQAAEKGLSLDASHRQCRETKAKVLLGLERPREALPILRELVAQRSTPQLEFYLGSALLGSGDAAGARDKLSGLLKGGKSSALFPDEPLGDGVEVQAARAQNELGHGEEAARLLLGPLSRDPQNVQALHELARVAKALGAKATAALLNRRIRQLVPRQKLLQSARQARGAGHPSSVLYYQAEAALLIGNTGEALELLEKALELSPKLALLYLEKARVYLLLGRNDLAERLLRQGLKEGALPLLAAELARVLALRGQGEASRRLLSESLPRPPGRGQDGEGVEGEMEKRDFLVALRARAFLELGETSMAKKMLEEEGTVREEHEETSLCRAEIALLERNVGLARGILGTSHDEARGCDAWASALRAVCESSEGARNPLSPPQDPSDLLDHPRLYLRATYPPPESGTAIDADAALRWWEAIRSAGKRRLEILSKMQGFSDSDVVPLWRDLLSLYRDLKAARKAREVAWYIIHLHPNVAEEWLELARVLSAEEDVMGHLSALERALRINPGDKNLENEIASARARLGLRP